MAKGTVGVTCMAADPVKALANIEKAAAMGIPAAWLTGGGAGGDSIGILTAAAVKTSKILLGTCIIPTWPRHPAALIGQAQVVASLAPGRFRLGIGPSHQPTMAGQWGFDFVRPLHHLREYLTVLNAMNQDGKVDFDGERYRVHMQSPYAPKVPVMISTLRTGAFRLAGEMTDGAITWVTPVSYVQNTALPVLRAAAAAASRAAPPVILHAPVAVHENAAEVREAARVQLAAYPRLPFYVKMFEAAGFAEAGLGWSDAMVDAVVLHGDETEVRTKLDSLFAAGVTEVIAMPVASGADRAASAERTWRLIADYAKS